MIAKSISKNSIILGLFAIVVAATMAQTEIATRKQREASIRKVQSMALEQVIPPSLHNNTLLDDSIAVDDKEYLKLKKKTLIHIARLNSNITAFIIPTYAPDGYSGGIQSLVGIDLEGNIIGVRAITHGETPGLGDRIDIKKTNWILGFNAKSLTNTSAEQWHVKKDKGIFDQFTGATITPRAVVASVHNALLYFDKHKAELISAASTSVTIKTEGAQ